MANNIKDVTYEDVVIDGKTVMGHPSLPQRSYPGYDVEYPTCSKPGGENAGCDAWKKCTTPGEGPYMVAFRNRAGRKDFCHCRQWMYKLQFKHGYEALGKNPEDKWEDQIMEEYIDPEDPKKGTRTKRQKMKIENVRYPRPTREHPEDRRAPEIRDVQIEYNAPVNVPPVATPGIKESAVYGDRGTDNPGSEAGYERPVGDQGNRQGRGRPKRDDEGRG